MRGGPGRPSDCDVEFLVTEALDLRLDEKSADLRREAGQLAVSRKRNPLYLSMMIADESHVPKEAPKMRFDPVIGGERQRNFVEGLGTAVHTFVKRADGQLRV